MAIDWKAVLDGVDQALTFFRSQNVKPTLRTLFYNLYSKGLLPNTKTAYQSLSKHLVEARKQRRYEWDFLADITRQVYGELKDDRFNDDVLEKFTDLLEDKLEDFDLESILTEYFDYTKPYLYVSKWADQDQVCEIWIEKEALASTLVKWTQEHVIPIRVNRGYSSWTFIYNNARSLAYTLRNHSKVTIFYLGDLDPSGVDIQRFLEESLMYFGLDPSKVVFTRLGVTSEQVEEYNLPPRPEDAETLEKLERDPRNRGYTEDYVVEVDALIAYVPDEFHRLVEESINSVWDEDLYNDLRQKAGDLQEQVDQELEDYKEKAREKLRGLLDKEGSEV
jgi:hypothetical protein